jgi:hypothetical protein
MAFSMIEKKHQKAPLALIIIIFVILAIPIPYSIWSLFGTFIALYRLSVTEWADGFFALIQSVAFFAAMLLGATYLITYIISLIYTIRKKAISFFSFLPLVHIVAFLLFYSVELIPYTLERNIANQEIAQRQEEILNLESWANLTSLGLGHYKLEKPENASSAVLWDVTQPTRSGNTILVFGHASDFSFRWEEIRLFDIHLYEDIYISVNPEEFSLSTDESPFFHVYLSKEFNEDANFFLVIVNSEETIGKLKNLPER